MKAALEAIMLGLLFAIILVGAMAGVKYLMLVLRLSEVSPY